MSLKTMRTFKHDDKWYAIRSNGTMVDVTLAADSDELVLLVDRNSNVHVFEGRYGHIEHFAHQYEFFKAPISTRIKTGSNDYFEAIELVTRHYLTRKQGA